MENLKSLDWSTKSWPLQTLAAGELAFLQQLAENSRPKQETSDLSRVQKLIGNSDLFPIKFPIESIRLRELCKSFDANILARNITSTYPIIHERALLLFTHFLEFKNSYGTSKEKDVYKSMNILDLVDRLLLKRSLIFCGTRDYYMLLSKHEGFEGWESVGKENEKAPLVMRDCLTYDEMKLSALLYVTGRTVFINDGNRKNEGVVDPNLEQNVQKEGVIMGLVGTRMERRKVMEHEECIISAGQNSAQNGFGGMAPSKQTLDKIPLLSTFLGNYASVDASYRWRQLWFRFYDADSLTFEEAKSANPYNVASPGLQQNSEVERKMADSALIQTADWEIFNNEMYFKRNTITFDILLLDSNERAKQDNTTAYVHVVGIGLGSWMYSMHQTNVFIKAFISRIRELLRQHLLLSVSDVHFAYLNDILPDIAIDGMLLENKLHPLGGVKIHISKREPSSKLAGEHSGKLLVESYAWNGNAHPGNDFWKGILSTTGDPAAACSTQIAELHNARINPEYVSGKNLHVAGRFGVKHIADYCQMALKSSEVIERNEYPNDS